MKSFQVPLCSAAWVRFSVVLLVLSSVVNARKNHNQPHPHQGILNAYKPGPFSNMKLTNSDEQKLAGGEAVMKQIVGDKSRPEAGGTAICVQDVEAPKEAVWNQILDFDSYKGKVPKVVESRNYFVGSSGHGPQRIKTKMVVGVLPGYSYESYYDHHYHSKESSLTWKLDYDKTSDFDDVSGHWHVEDHPTKPHASRVFYACDIKLSGSVPKPILNYISKAALKQATGWVKKESEKNPEAGVPEKYGGKTKETTGRLRKFGFGRK